MEAGAARYRFEEMDVAVLVRRVVAETESSARESGTRIDVDGPVSDVWVRGDHNALALAVRNLLENAIKYSPGQPSVRLELRQQDGHVSVDVIDSGIGIPRSEQQAIFDKFVRGRAAIDANVSGTGVGLAMVRQIIRAHGGDVEVQSEVGQGSRFRLVMPIINSQLPISNSQKGTAVEAVVRS
jgi:signal transduction histidine kinase